MRAEVIGPQRDGVLPALDGGGERGVDILEGLLGSGIAGFADTVEDAAGLGLLLGFVGEEGEFERDLLVGGVESHCFAELVAGEVVFTDLQIRVGEVFADGGARGGGGDSGEEAGDCGVVITNAEGIVSAGERGVSGIGRLRERSTARDKTHYGTHIALAV